MIATMASIDDAAVDRVRAAHPGVFPTTGDLLKKWAPHLIALIYVLGSLWYFEVWRFLNVSELVWGLVRMFVPWNWEDMGDWQYGNIYNAIAQTMAMAMLGTFLGTLGAMVVGFLGARNVMSGFPFNIIRQVVRRFLDILRGIDQLVWGLVFVRAVGLGPLAGVLAIFVSDLGTLSKLYSEAIENIDRKQVEGIKSTGAGPLAVIRYGYIPQVLAGLHLAELVFLGEQHPLGHHPRHRGGGRYRDDPDRTLPRGPL